MRIALGLEYDGTPYCGWQHQLSGCAVQDHLESALTAFTGTVTRAVAAGRTDAGVHARAQVVHLDTEAIRDDNAWVRGTNAHLPRAIRVLWARPVPAGFHARFSAASRTYQYLVFDDPVAPALLAGRVGWFHRSLAVDLMHAAALCLVGERDFSAFRDAQCQARTPVRTVHEARVERVGPLVCLTITANAFLHHMVRNILGSLVYVGAGRQPVEWVKELLDSRDRRLAAPTFSPDGLYLAGIAYDSSFGLPDFRPSALLQPT